MNWATTPNRVALVAPQHAEQLARAALVRAGIRELLDDRRSLLDGDEDEDENQHKRQTEVGAHHRPELTRTDRVQLGRRQRRDVDRVDELGQDQRRSEQHADVRADRVKRLGKVQAPRRSALRTERHHVRVRGRLENRTARRHREQGDQERLVGHDLARWEEQESAESRKRQTSQNARLVAEALINERRRQREQEVGAEVRELHQRRLKRAHREDALEARNHRRGQVLGNPPCGKAADQRDEQQQHAPPEQRLAPRGLGLRGHRPLRDAAQRFTLLP
jgi:hypothetical protein